jgi:isoquinoline 1-oxidoreductase alpha subunit
MPKYVLTINDKPYNVEAAADTPLLWVIRDLAGLKGTKYGCGMALCGACTIHLNGQAVRSCSIPVSTIRASQRITTIEGLSEANDHPLQKAWIEEQVPQCGYCQSGMIMSAAALLNSNPNPGEEDIQTALSGNLCRCGTYPRVKKAVQKAGTFLNKGQ